MQRGVSGKYVSATKVRFVLSENMLFHFFHVAKFTNGFRLTVRKAFKEIEVPLAILNPVIIAAQIILAKAQIPQRIVVERFAVSPDKIGRFHILRDRKSTRLNSSH